MSVILAIIGLKMPWPDVKAPDISCVEALLALRTKEQKHAMDN